MYLSPRDASGPAEHEATLKVFCGFALSSPYQPLVRIVLYPLLLAAFWSRTALLVVVLWTSVVAVHVCAIAYYQESTFMDTDIFPATNQLLLAILFAPAYIEIARGLKGKNQKDKYALCLWMMTLWAGMIGYIATTKSQPALVGCVDSAGNNVGSRMLLSECTFQCRNIGTHQAMRSGQEVTLISKPGIILEGWGQPLAWPLYLLIIILFGLTIMGFWMATKESVMDRMNESIKKRKRERDQENVLKAYLAPIKLAVLMLPFLVGFGEDGLKHLPGTMERDSISQWGPLVAFAFVCVWLSARWLLTKLSAKLHLNVNWTKRQRHQHDVAMGLIEPRTDIEAGSPEDMPIDRSPTADVALPEAVHAPNADAKSLDEVGRSSNSHSLKRSATM